RYRKHLTRRLILQNEELQTLLEDFSFQELNEILYQLFLAKLSNPQLKALEWSDLENLHVDLQAKTLQEAETVCPLIQPYEGFADFLSYLKELQSDFTKLNEIENVRLPRASKKIALDESQWLQVKT